MSPVELQIEDLRHRLKVECAVIEGAKNVLKLCQAAGKVTDRKVFQEVGSYSLSCFDLESGDLLLGKKDWQYYTRGWGLMLAR